jgi:hypothetical protein
MRDLPQTNATGNDFGAATLEEGSTESRLFPEGSGEDHRQVAEFEFAPIRRFDFLSPLCCKLTTESLSRTRSLIVKIPRSF